MRIPSSSRPISYPSGIDTLKKYRSSTEMKISAATMPTKIAATISMASMNPSMYLRHMRAARLFLKRAARGFPLRFRGEGGDPSLAQASDGEGEVCVRGTASSAIATHLIQTLPPQAGGEGQSEVGAHEKRAQ